MADVFYEETAVCSNLSSEKRKYYTFKSLSIIFIVLTVIWGLIIISSYDLNSLTTGLWALNVLFLIIPIVSAIGFSIVFNKLKNKCCLDYDYVFVSGSLRISKVINNVKRRNIYNFDTSNIEKIGKFASETYSLYEKMPNVKTVILTSNNQPSEGKNFFYMAVNNVETKKLLLVFECTNVFIRNVMKFTKSYILEKDFK